MVKRIVFGLVLTGLCLVGLAGCGGGGNEPKSQTTGQLQPQAAPAGPNESGGRSKAAGGVQ